MAHCNTISFSQNLIHFTCIRDSSMVDSFLGCGLSYGAISLLNPIRFKIHRSICPPQLDLHKIIHLPTLNNLVCLNHFHIMIDLRHLVVILDL